MNTMQNEGSGVGGQMGGAGEGPQVDHGGHSETIPQLEEGIWIEKEAWDIVQPSESS